MLRHHRAARMRSADGSKFTYAPVWRCTCPKSGNDANGLMGQVGLSGIVCFAVTDNVSPAFRQSTRPLPQHLNHTKDHLITPTFVHFRTGSMSLSQLKRYKVCNLRYRQPIMTLSSLLGRIWTCLRKPFDASSLTRRLNGSFISSPKR